MLKNSLKAPKTHRERHQPRDRAHLGLLEKKKDYKLRANDYNEKKATLKLLRKRALNKNPDEFYFHMINSRIEDGEHRELEKEDETTDAQRALMQTQDLKYISHKRMVERRKIERLQSELHLMDVEGKPKNKHIFFVDSKKEAKRFDVAKRLDTLPELLDRPYNRPTISQLSSMSVIGNVDEAAVQKMAEERKKKYKELKKRIEREKELLVIQQKMELKRSLAGTKESAPERVKSGTKDAPPIYRWRRERKR